MCFHFKQDYPRQAISCTVISVFIGWFWYETYSYYKFFVWFQSCCYFIHLFIYFFYVGLTFFDQKIKFLFVTSLHCSYIYIYKYIYWNTEGNISFVNCFKAFVIAPKKLRLNLLKTGQWVKTCLKVSKRLVSDKQS